LLSFQLPPATQGLLTELIRLTAVITITTVRIGLHFSPILIMGKFDSNVMVDVLCFVHPERCLKNNLLLFGVQIGSSLAYKWQVSIHYGFII